MRGCRFDIQGQVKVPKWMNLQKGSKGGRGVIFNPKKYIADFGNFKQGLLSMKLIQKSNFRVQGMFLFNNFMEKNQNKTHFEEGTSEPPSPPPSSGTFPKIHPY